MLMKTCTKCGKSYPATREFFHREVSARDGLHSWCKPCAAAYIRIYNQIHAEEIRTAHNLYREAHKEQAVAYREAHKKEAVAVHRIWAQQNREEIAERRRKYRHQIYHGNPMVRLSRSISSRMRRALAGGKAGHQWESLVGYTLDDLMHHIEGRFQPGMSWVNHGIRGWHIDHIQPIASFHFETPDDPEFKKCWALENLQPMWWSDNRQKSAKDPALLGTDQRVRRRRGR